SRATTTLSTQSRTSLASPARRSSSPRRTTPSRAPKPRHTWRATFRARSTPASPTAITTRSTPAPRSRRGSRTSAGGSTCGGRARNRRHDGRRARAASDRSPRAAESSDAAQRRALSARRSRLRLDAAHRARDEPRGGIRPHDSRHRARDAADHDGRRRRARRHRPLGRSMSTSSFNPSRSLAAWRGCLRYLADGRSVEVRGPALERDVEATRRSFARLGLGRDARVGILAGNSYEWVVVDLALQRLGALVVACPEHFAADAPRTLVDRLALDALCVLAREQGPPADAPPALLTIDDLAVRRADERHDALPAGRDVPPHWRPETDEYTVVFSSGTSGRVRGMMVNREGTEDTIDTFVHAFDVRASDTVLVALPLSNLQQRLMVYGALAHGCDVAVMPPARMLHALQRFQPTIVVAPPIFYQLLVDRFEGAVGDRGVAAACALAAVRRAGRALPPAAVRPVARLAHRPLHDALGGRIRVMVTGMAPTPRRVFDSLRGAGLPLFEAYGTTETGIVATNALGVE